MGFGISGLWTLGRLPASYQGLPFVVLENSIRRGRQVALHTYPFRDDPWPEDVGRSPRITSFRGFVLGDTCDAQIAALTAAVEKPGPGVLVHPTLGTLTVTVLEFVCTDNPERGRMWSFDMTVVPYVARIYPALANNTQGQTQSLFATVGSAIVANFGAVTDFLGSNLAAVASVVNIATAFTGAALGLVGSATSLASVAVGIVGNFGRFSSGGLASNAAGVGAFTTVEDAAAAATATIAEIASTAATIGTLAAQPGLDATALATQAQTLTEQVRTACNDPADAIQAMTSLVGTPTSVTNPAALTAPAFTAALFRRSALASLGLATADFQPTSSTQANAEILAIGALFDSEIVAAADAGQDACYLALRQMRQAIVADLRARSADLPALVTVSLPGNLPSLALAYRLYGDVQREPGMVAMADVSAPGFMPASFQALAA